MLMGSYYCDQLSHTLIILNTLIKNQLPLSEIKIHHIGVLRNGYPVLVYLLFNLIEGIIQIFHFIF